MFCLLLFTQMISKLFHGTCIYLLLFSCLSRLCKYINITPHFLPVPVAARSKAWICGCLLVGIVGSNPVGGMDVYVVSVGVVQIEVSATGQSLVQGSPTECGVSECDREVSIMRRPLPTRGAVAP
jgi:hypothetical protein